MKKWIFLFAAYFVGIMGSLVKPTVLVVVIAITVLELVQGIKSLKMEWKELLIKIAMIAVVALLYKGVQLVIYDVTSYTPNEEISATYHHYLLMGLNEETTGGYYSGDFAFLEALIRKRKEYRHRLL